MRKSAEQLLCQVTCGLDGAVPLTATLDIQGGPKKVSHYQSSSLNHIKNGQQGNIFHQFRM